MGIMFDFDMPADTELRCPKCGKVICNSSMNSMVDSQIVVRCTKCGRLVSIVMQNGLVAVAVQQKSETETKQKQRSLIS